MDAIVHELAVAISDIQSGFPAEEAEDYLYGKLENLVPAMREQSARLREQHQPAKCAAGKPSHTQGRIWGLSGSRQRPSSLSQGRLTHLMKRPSFFRVQSFPLDQGMVRDPAPLSQRAAP